MTVQLPKAPIPTSGGSGGAQLLKIAAEAGAQVIAEKIAENLLKKRPNDASEHPPVPDAQADEFLCIQATNYNTYAISEIPPAIDHNTAMLSGGFTELTNAVNAQTRVHQAILEQLQYALPYVGWTKDVVELFFKLEKQNADLLLQRLAQVTQEFTGRQVQPLNQEEIEYNPTQDLQVDVRIDGLEIEELPVLAELTLPEEPPQP